MTVGVWLSMRDPKGQRQNDDTCTAQTQSGFEGETTYQPAHDGMAPDPKEGGEMQRGWSPGKESAARSRHDQLSFLSQRGAARPTIVDAGSAPK
jgi:hypothetical protein